eukprot:TRINITY_DN25932_c0_g1_i1.p1 TRINITY_DN25932_c0_g1~~TRINITY_DN25932_c0_g1_i1.p1  ORF type:complete len:278 (-),score=55.83 TRINITY_DN25932_c0_g1_i1:1-834(-)
MKKFLLLHCEDLPKWQPHKNIYKELIYPEDEQVIISVWNKEKLPSVEELNSYSGIVISGSRWGAYDDEEWIKELLKWIAEYWKHSQQINHKNYPKLAGICFGHQIINHALGGVSGKNTQNEEKYLFGVETVAVTPAFQNKSYVQNAWKQTLELRSKESWHPKQAESERKTVQHELGVPKTFKIYESHGDAVNVLIPGAELFGSSPKTNCESYTLSDRVIGFQGHPEFSEHIMRKVILPDNDRRMSHEEMNFADLHLQEEKTDYDFIGNILRNFFAEQ